MAFTWGTIDDTFDWTDHNNLNIFDKAVYQRAWAAQLIDCSYLARSDNTIPAPTAIPAYVPAWSIGDDPLDSSRANTSVMPLGAPSTIGSYQQMIGGAASVFVDPSIDPPSLGFIPPGCLQEPFAGDSDPSVGVVSDIVNAITLNGLDGILRSLGYADNYIPGDTTPGEGSVSWHRECPRVVLTYRYSANPTTDTEGNDFADGMLAMVRTYVDLDADGTIYPIFIGKYNATRSTWVPQPFGTLPDTLKSDSDRPNFCQPGPMVKGDYLGLWQFKQLMQVMQKMKRSFIIMAGSDIYHPGYLWQARGWEQQGGTVFYSEPPVGGIAVDTLSGVVNVCDAQFAGSYVEAPGGSSGSYGGMSSFKDNDYVADSLDTGSPVPEYYYEAGLKALGFEFVFAGLPIPKVFDTYAGITPLLPDNVYGTGTAFGGRVIEGTFEMTFNDNGLGLTNRTYNKVYSVSSGEFLVYTPCFPPVDSPPTWSPTPRVPTTHPDSDQTATGFNAIAPYLTLVTWTFDNP